MVMTSQEPSGVTEILRRLTHGDAAAVDQLTPLVYRELRYLAGSYMNQERPNHTLQATALVHEAYMRLVDQTRVQWQGRAHFLAVAAQAMRRILVDHARARATKKRGDGWERVPESQIAGVEGTAPIDLLALNHALDNLAAEEPRKARVVEMRYFGGLEIKEIAEALEVSSRTVDRDWRLAQVLLYDALEGDGPRDEDGK